MKTKPLKRLVSVSLCVLTLCVFGGRSFSADTVISVLPQPENPFMKSNAGECPGCQPGIFGLPELADLSGTGLDGTRDLSDFPPNFSLVFINDKVLERESLDVTDQVKVEIQISFGDVTAGYTTQGERFVVVSTPWGKWFSFVNGKIVEGIQGEPFTVPKDKVREVIVNRSLLGLPLGPYRFYLAFDERLNGVVDYDSLTWTYGTAVLRNPIEVSLSASPLSGPAPLKVTYQVMVEDPLDTSVTCKLLLEDGEFPCEGYTHTFTEQGNHPARVEVIDKFGRSVLSDIVTVTVEPKNQPPTVSNLSVTPNEVYSYEESFSIHYYYDDPDGKDDVDWHVIEIGSWTKDYLAGGSGEFLHSYNFVEDTTPGTHGINVHVIDSAGNHSNTLSSSVYFGGGPKECGTFTEAGSDAAETHYVEMGQTSGWFWFDYETFNQKDRIIITYEENQLVLDTGCVGTNGKRSAHIKFGPGNSTKIKVQVQPNCAGGTGTQWNFTVHCPDTAPY